MDASRDCHAHHIITPEWIFPRTAGAAARGQPRHRRSGDGSAGWRPARPQPGGPARPDLCRSRARRGARTVADVVLHHLRLDRDGNRDHVAGPPRGRERATTRPRTALGGKALSDAPFALRARDCVVIASASEAIQNVCTTTALDCFGALAPRNDTAEHPAT